MDRNEKQNSFRNRKNVRGSQRTIRKLQKKNSRMTGLVIVLSVLVCALAGLSAYQYINPRQIDRISPHENTQDDADGLNTGSQDAAGGGSGTGDEEENSQEIEILTEEVTEKASEESSENLSETVSEAESETEKEEKQTEPQGTEKITETETQNETETEKETETETEEMTEDPEKTDLSKEIQKLVGDGEAKAWQMVTEGRTTARKNAQNTSKSAELARLFVLGAMYNRMNRGVQGEVDEEENVLSVYGTGPQLADLPYHVLGRVNQGDSAGSLAYDDPSAATDDLICRMGFRSDTYEEDWSTLDKTQPRQKGVKAVKAFAADNFKGFELKESDNNGTASYSCKEKLEDCVAFMAALGEPVVDEAAALWGPSHRYSLMNALAAQAEEGTVKSAFLERMLALRNAGDGTGTFGWAESCSEKGFETVLLYVQDNKAPSVFGIFSPEDAGHEWAEKLADLVWKEMTGQTPAAAQEEQPETSKEEEVTLELPDDQEDQNEDSQSQDQTQQSGQEQDGQAPDDLVTPPDENLEDGEVWLDEGISQDAAVYTDNYGASDFVGQGEYDESQDQTIIIYNEDQEQGA